MKWFINYGKLSYKIFVGNFFSAARRQGRRLKIKTRSRKREKEHPRPQWGSRSARPRSWARRSPSSTCRAWPASGCGSRSTTSPKVSGCSSTSCRRSAMVSHPRRRLPSRLPPRATPSLSPILSADLFLLLLLSLSLSLCLSVCQSISSSLFFFFSSFFHLRWLACGQECESRNSSRRGRTPANPSIIIITIIVLVVFNLTCHFISAGPHHGHRKRRTGHPR